MRVLGALVESDCRRDVPTQGPNLPARITRTGSCSRLRMYVFEQRILSISLMSAFCLGGAVGSAARPSTQARASASLPQIGVTQGEGLHITSFWSDLCLFLHPALCGRTNASHLGGVGGREVRKGFADEAPSFLSGMAYRTTHYVMESLSAGGQGLRACGKVERIVR